MERKDCFLPLYENSGQSACRMAEEIGGICRRFGKRAPGSPGERGAAEYLAAVLKNECGCGEVQTERFRVHPSSFYSYCRLSSCLDCFACLGFFIHPALSLISGSLSMLLFLFFFVLYIPFIDPLFPERESVNVTAVRPAAGEVKRRILLNGHLDASWEFTLNYRFGGIVFEIPNIMATACVLLYITLSVCALCGAGPWVRQAALWGTLFLPFCVAVWFTYNPKQVVDGANDNLSGCCMGITLLREMERHGISPEHTEVGVILTGSEEAGLRGAKAWCREHREDYRDVPTFILCFDTIHDPRFLMVNERDLNNTVAADPALAGLFLRAAAEAGVPCRRGRVPLFGGATDSAAFVQGGFRSAGVTGLNHKLESYYHTRKDTAENLNREGLENCYRALVRTLEAIDRGELD